MGGATGSRERAPDDRLRDTHQIPARKRDGFRSALPILQTPGGHESWVALRLPETTADIARPPTA